MVLMAIDHVRVYAGVPAGGPDPASLLHPLGDALLRTGLRVLRRRVGLPASRDAAGHGRAVAVPADSRVLAGRARADGDAVRVDLQLRRDQLQPRRRAVDDRLEHGRARAAWSGCRSTPSPRSASRSCSATTSSIRTCAISGARLARVRSDGSGSFSTSAARCTLGESGPRIAILYSLLPWIGVMAAGYAFGTVLRVADRAAPSRLPRDRRRRDRAVHRAADVQPLRRSAALESPQQPLSFLNTDEVSGVAAVPADDARAADPLMPLVRARARRHRRRARDSSAACRCSITCCTFR